MHNKVAVNRAVRWYDYITVNIYWFGLTARAQVLTALVIPLMVQGFVGEEVKGAYLGQIRLWALAGSIWLALWSSSFRNGL